MSFEQDYNKELYHYGVKGMKWGVRKVEAKVVRNDRKRSTDSDGLASAAKRYDKKASRGSLHNIVGFAYENTGYKKAADRAYKKGDFKEAKWRAKASRARGVKKAYDSYISDLYKLENAGKQNDVEAVIQRSKLYDSQVASVKNQYRQEIRRAKSAIYGN